MNSSSFSPPVPRGTISVWHGQKEYVPAGWVVCDGKNYTPDLRGKAVICPENGFAYDEDGGAKQHDHPVTMEIATDQLKAGTGGGGAGGTVGTELAGHVHVAQSGKVDNLPPFRCLWYIMKT